MTIYYFSHLIQPWLFPPGLNFLIILLGLIFSLLSRVMGAMITLIGFVTLWLLSTPIISYKLIDTLQNQYPILQSAHFNHNNSHDAIVVLGGGSIVQREYGNEIAVSDNTLRRVNYAAYLYKQTHVPIIVSGGSGSKMEKANADLMYEMLKDNFNIIAKFKEDKGLTTAEESIFIVPILKQNHINRVYLVTDAWHMPRSMYIFQCRGINAIASPTDYIVNESNYSLLNLFPNAQALYTSSIAFHEYIGMLWYHFRYGNTCV